MRTPLQIIVIRNRADRRTEVYVDTLRLAFEGSADSAGSASAYLSDAVDLGIRVLEPAEHPCCLSRVIRGSEVTSSEVCPRFIHRSGRHVAARAGAEALHSRSSRNSTLARMIILRMTAVTATLCFLPLRISRS